MIPKPEIIGNDHSLPSLRTKSDNVSMAIAMQRRGKKSNPSDWRFTMEQIGRELGKVYRQPKRLPPAITRGRHAIRT